MNIPILTVFTPAYNRAHTLGRTFESLKRQSNKNFVWLIIDDGSTDNTRELVQNWLIQDNGFEIQYVYKKNGGMHTGHNLAYKLIETELNVCIDSDDYMTDDAVEKILSCWKIEKNNQKVCGIIALDISKNGNVIGTELPKHNSYTTLLGFYQNGGKGDKKLIYRTETMNQYPPYPEFENEKYVGLAYKYYLADQEYVLKILNEPVCVVEYQDDGSSNNMFSQYFKNPKGFAFYRKEYMKIVTSPQEIFRTCIHYVSSSILANNSSFLKESPRKVYTFLAIPFGIVLTLLVKSKYRRG